MLRKKQNQKAKRYAKNKSAFDSVMSHYRSLNGIGSIPAINIEKGSSGGTANPARPTPLDFLCDVERTLVRVVPKRYMTKFIVVYILIECLTALEQEMLADRVIGGARHSIEQRVGESFIARKVHPVQGKGYFHCVRKQRPRGQ